jgi:AraC family transcriptional regulator
MSLDNFRGVDEVTLLVRGHGLVAGDWICAGARPVADERAAGHQITFVRRGAFRVESDHAAFLADPTSVMLLEAGADFHVSHPAGCNDRCLFLELEPRYFCELLAPTHPWVTERPDRPFPRAAVSCSLTLAAAQLRFLREVHQAPGDTLAGGEAALGLLHALFDSLPGARSPRQDPTRPARRRERIEAVRVILHQRLSENLTLSDLARAVHSSPFHLARQFRVETGESIHQYRLRLRLGAALERLAAGEGDLTGLALDLGFSDHAHFSSAFRRRFGATPSSYRGRLRSA